MCVCVCVGGGGGGGVMRLILGQISGRKMHLYETSTVTKGQEDGSFRRHSML